MLHLVYQWFRRFLSDGRVAALYKDAGGVFGSAVSYLYMGECIGFERLLEHWRFWEHEYAQRGYHTLSVDDLVDYGGYGKDIEAKLLVRREEGEDPVYHANIYRQRHLGKVKPVVDIEKMFHDGQVQYRTYVLPSTKDASIDQTS